MDFHYGPFHIIADYITLVGQWSAMGLSVCILLLLAFKMRKLPIGFMLLGCCGKAHCYLDSIELVAEAGQMKVFQGSWLCGNLTLIRTDEGSYISTRRFGDFEDDMFLGCTITRNSESVVGFCTEKPPILKNPTVGVDIDSKWICGNYSTCHPTDSCLYNLDMKDICGKPLNLRFDEHQKFRTCNHKVRGWKDDDGTHGVVAIPQGITVKETMAESWSFGMKGGSAGHCKCIQTEKRNLLPPFTMMKPYSNCEVEEWFGKPPMNYRGPDVDICMEKDSISHNLNLWMLKVANVEGDIKVTVRGSSTTFSYSSRAMSMFRTLIRRGMSCGLRNLNAGNDTCMPPMKGCPGGCWPKMSFGSRSRRAAISLFWGLFEVEWGGNEVLSDSEADLLKRMAGEVDSNSARIALLEKKLDLLSRVTWEGFCSNGTHAAHGSLKVNFTDGDTLDVRDWCSPETFRCFMEKRPVNYHQLSEVAKLVIDSRIHSKVKSHCLSLSGIITLNIILLIFFAVVKRLRDFTSSHFHGSLCGKETCYGPHRFSHRFSRGCTCGAVSLKVSERLVLSKCNNRTTLPRCLQDLPVGEKLITEIEEVEMDELEMVEVKPYLLQAPME